MAELDLKGFDAELKVISARSTTVAEMQRLITDTGPDPQAWLPRFLGEDPSSTAQEVP